eukprot:TRINITY_DN6891_c0_g1_i5.p1 TRINITY_DN6891_c0_g1~~TRINITY_DN6891_c0_g1_i5.p1  ORF type:complete len:102 (-),score=12.15 TRINITY_DN6891_c0_g1_i5:518-823(-)
MNLTISNTLVSLHGSHQTSLLIIPPILTSHRKCPFSIQTDFCQGTPTMQSFKFGSRGVGIINTTTGTTPFLLPSSKSTTSLAAFGQNQATKPHVAAIAQKK